MNLLPLAMRDPLKPRNTLYVVFPIIVLVAGVLFFTSRLWIGDDRAIKDLGYDTTARIAGAWEYKVTDALYDPESEELSFSLYLKEAVPEHALRPTFTVSLGTSRAELAYSTEAMSGNEYGARVTVGDVPKNWYFVRVYLTSETLTAKQEATVDSFGNVIEPEEVKLDPVLQMVEIDYRIADWRESE